MWYSKKNPVLDMQYRIFFKIFFYFFLRSLFIPYPNATVNNANIPPSIGNPGGGGAKDGDGGVGVCENTNSAVINTTSIKIILSVFFFHYIQF